MEDIWDDLVKRNEIEHQQLKTVADDHLDRVDRAISQYAAILAIGAGFTKGQVVPQANPTASTS